MTLPLEGIRILDLTWWIAGPLATMQMAMMGAEVIRLESRARPDSMRLTTPFAENEPGVNRSGRWNSHNFSKHSAALNLSKPEGAELAKRLVAWGAGLRAEAPQGEAAKDEAAKDEGKS